MLACVVLELGPGVLPGARVGDASLLEAPVAPEGAGEARARGGGGAVGGRARRRWCAACLGEVAPGTAAAAGGGGRRRGHPPLLLLLRRRSRPAGSTRSCCSRRRRLSSGRRGVEALHALRRSLHRRERPVPSRLDGQREPALVKPREPPLRRRRGLPAGGAEELGPLDELGEAAAPGPLVAEDDGGADAALAEGVEEKVEACGLPCRPRTVAGKSRSKVGNRRSAAKAKKQRAAQGIRGANWVVKGEKMSGRPRRETHRRGPHCCSGPARRPDAIACSGDRIERTRVVSTGRARCPKRSHSIRRGGGGQAGGGRHHHHRRRSKGGASRGASAPSPPHRAGHQRGRHPPRLRVRPLRRPQDPHVAHPERLERVQLCQEAAAVAARAGASQVRSIPTGRRRRKRAVRKESRLTTSFIDEHRWRRNTKQEGKGKKGSASSIRRRPRGAPEVGSDEVPRRVVVLGGELRALHPHEPPSRVRPCGSRRGGSARRVSRGSKGGGAAAAGEQQGARLPATRR